MVADATMGIALTASQTFGNLLANAGFEDPITFEGTVFTGSWEGFSGGGRASVTNASTMPRTGAQHLNASIVNSNNNFAGVFQDVVGLVPGQTGIFSVWQKAPTLPLDLDVEMRIEWRKVGQAAEVGRTPNFVSTPGITTDYQQFSVMGVVPAGADTARVVYAVQTFSGGAGNTGTLFVDDTSFVVPEPAALGLFMCAMVTLVNTRRRRGA